MLSTGLYSGYNPYANNGAFGTGMPQPWDQQQSNNLFSQQNNSFSGGFNPNPTNMGPSQLVQQARTNNYLPGQRPLQQWQIENSRPFVPNSPWQMQYAQQNGMWGQQPNYDRSSQTPTSNYPPSVGSYQDLRSQNPFIQPFIQNYSMPPTQNSLGFKPHQIQNPFMQNPQMAQLMQILSLIQNMGFGGRQSTSTSYIPTMGAARYTGQSSGPTQEQTQNWLNSISQAGRDWYNAGSPRDPNAPLGTWANPRPL